MLLIMLLKDVYCICLVWLIICSKSRLFIFIYLYSYSSIYIHIHLFIFIFLSLIHIHLFILIFIYLYSYSSIYIHIHAFLKTQEKIIGQTCVCLCCDNLYLRILGVFFLNGINFTKVTWQQKCKSDRYFCFL